MQKTTDSFVALIDLIRTLRGPNGCPWDRKQTPADVKSYLVEELYEVLEAIDRGDKEHLQEEVGDLLFMILFLTNLYEENNTFTLKEALDGIIKKMIHRHPHVFGSATVRSAEEVAENWDKIKKQERGAAESSPKLLMDVPAGLPALLRAHRLIERAGRLRSPQGQGETILKNVEDALGSFRENAEGKNREAVGDDIGSSLFHLADLARHWGLNAESLLRKANDRFLDDFQEGEEP